MAIGPRMGNQTIYAIPYPEAKLCNRSTRAAMPPPLTPPACHEPTACGLLLALPKENGALKKNQTNTEQHKPHQTKPNQHHTTPNTKQHKPHQKKPN